MFGLGLKLGQKVGGGGAAPPAPFVNALSMALDGTNEYLRITNHASLQMTTNLTISAWVKGNNSVIGGIVSKDDYGASQRSYDMFQDSAAATKFSGFVSSTGAAGTDYKHYTSSITAFDNTWHHIAMTFSPNTLKLYVDGVLDPSPTIVANPTVNSIFVGTADLTFGTILNSNLPTLHYLGRLDEPSIWNVTLTDAEIAEIYNAGEPTDLTTHSQAAGLVSWWRMGDDAGDSITSILDQVSTNHATPTNMESGDIVADVP